MYISRQTLCVLFVLNPFFLSGLIGQDTENLQLSKYSIKHLKESLDTFLDVTKEVTYQLPQENKVVFYKDIYLQWDKSYETVDTRLQISTTNTFQNLVLDTIVKGSHMVIPSLSKHRDYYWRVSNVLKDKITTRNFSFFKTTPIHMDESEDLLSIEVIPTWIDSTEVLFIHNPDLLKYHLQVNDENGKIRLKKDCSNGKYAFETNSWPRGSYLLTLLISNYQVQTKSFLLK